MTNSLENKLKDLIKNIIKDNYNILIDDIRLDIPPKKELGDFAFGCFVLSKDLKKSPNDIASSLVSLINGNEIIDSVSSDGPYLNIKLNKIAYINDFLNFYTKDFLDISKKENNNKTIVIDYIGANVGKPLHIGHMCTPNQGQVLINLYKKLGYKVVSDSHIGDWGIIFGKLILAYKMWGNEEKLKENAVDYLLELYIKITKETEKHTELEQKTRDEFKLLSSGDKDSVKLWEKFTRYSINAMNNELIRLNIKPDYNIGESFYEGLGLPKMEDYPDLKWDMKSIVKELIEKGIATKNEDNSVGVIFDEAEKIPSCILQKRDFTHGYLASDLASIKYRMDNWNPEKIIYFVDVRQQLHLNQAFLISRKAGWVGDTELIHAYNGFISLKDGAMSTRTGRIIKLDKLLDEAEIRAEKIILEKRDDILGDELKEISKIIGVGAIKYGYLKKSRETDVVFDWDEFMSFEGNSGPYIQYAYVRAKNILKNAGDYYFDNSFLEKYNNKQEIDFVLNLIKELLKYRDVLEELAFKNMPHILANYCYKLTKEFNGFYNNVHVLNESSEKLKNFKLELVKIFSEVLKDSFEILGIKMPEKM